MLKWIVLYNSSFSNNHKELFAKLKEWEAKGKLQLERQCDYLNTYKDVEKLFDIVDNIEDLVTNKTKKELDILTVNQLKDKIITNPKKCLRSIISLWYLEEIDEYTRIDIGEVELNYLMEHEERSPKWIEQN